MSLVPSQKKSKKDGYGNNLFIDGHKFSAYLAKETSTMGFRIYWKCVTCKAKTVTNRNGVRDNGDAIRHSEGCVPDTDVERLAVAKTEFRRNVRNNAFTPTAVLVDQLRTSVPAHLQSQLPQKHTQKRNARNIRAGARSHLPKVSDLFFDFAEEYEFVTVRDGEESQMFLRYDSGPSQKRFLIFSTKNLLNILRQSHTWLIDGTFKISPNIFSQVVSIHGVGFNSDRNAFPGLFGLLADKNTATYVQFLRSVKSILEKGEKEDVLTCKSHARPTAFVCDFEKALHNAIEEVYDEATITGCYFHFAQSQRRQLSSILSDATTEQLLTIKKVRALAFLPVEDIVDAFDEVESVADGRLDDYLHYFKKNYIGRHDNGNWKEPRFSVAMWSLHERALEGEVITNNHVEGTHTRLASYFTVNHPEMWLFVDKLRQFVCGLEADLVDLSHGKNVKRQYVNWNRLRLQRQVMLDEYDSSRAQDFLTSMAGCIKP